MAQVTLGLEVTFPVVRYGNVVPLLRVTLDTDEEFEPQMEAAMKYAEKGFERFNAAIGEAVASVMESTTGQLLQYLESNKG